MSETSHPKPTSQRGGRRPGAGAPKGNLNALKHGRRSAQFAQLGALLAANPKTRAALLDLARRHNLKQQKAEEIAYLWFNRLLQHARDIAAGKPSKGPFAQLLRSNVQSAVDERRTINPEAAPDAGVAKVSGPETEDRAPHNQTIDTNGPEESNPERERAND